MTYNQMQLSGTGHTGTEVATSWGTYTSHGGAAETYSTVTTSPGVALMGEGPALQQPETGLQPLSSAPSQLAGATPLGISSGLPVATGATLGWSTVFGVYGGQGWALTLTGAPNGMLVSLSGAPIGALQWQVSLGAVGTGGGGGSGIVANASTFGVLSQPGSGAGMVPWSMQVAESRLDWLGIGTAESDARSRVLTARPAMDALGLAAALSWEAGLGSTPLIGSALVERVHNETNFYAGFLSTFLGPIVNPLVSEWNAWVKLADGNGTINLSSVPLPGGGSIAIDPKSTAFKWGGYAGTALQIFLPVGAMRYAALRGLNAGVAVTMTAGQGIGAGQALAQGDGTNAVLLLAQLGLTMVRAGSPCYSAAGLGAAGGLMAIAGYQGYKSASANFAAGNTVGGVLDILQAAVGMYMAGKGCFAGETPLRTEWGCVRADEVQVGMQLLSRDEYDPEGPVVPRVVEAVFVREALVWKLGALGRTIRSTAEHPFFVREKGWTPLNRLAVGDAIWTEVSGWVTVEVAEDTGEWATVYNCRIADFHTYFVGDLEWGFSLWAHNANYGDLPASAGKQVIRGRKLSEWAAEYVAASTPGTRTPKAAWGGNALSRAEYQKTIAYAEQHLGYAGKKSHSPGGGGAEKVRQLTGRWTDEVVEAGGGTVRSGGGTSRYATGQEAGVEVGGTWRKPDSIVSLSEGPLAGTDIYIQTVTVRGRAGRPHSYNELPQALDIAKFASTQGRRFEVILVPKTGTGPMWRVNAAGTGIEMIPWQATGADLLAHLATNPKG